MKKTLVVLLFVFAMSSTTAFALTEEPPVKTIKIVNVEKVNGRRSFLGLLGEVRYNKVSCTSSVSFVTNPATGHQDRVITTNYYCEGPGGERCRHTGGVSVRGVSVSETSEADDFTDTIINSILDLIDGKILEQEIYEGSLNKRYMFLSSIDNKPMYFNALVSWWGGKENGDAQIRIKIYDITERMQELLD